MNQTNQEKPSLILMLAPIALVLFSYHYLFHAKLNSDLSARRKQETSLQQKTQNIQRELSSMHGQLHAAKKELVEAKTKTAAANTRLAVLKGEKEKLRLFVLGRTDSEKGQPAFEIGSDAQADQVGSDAAVPASRFAVLSPNGISLFRRFSPINKIIRRFSRASSPRVRSRG